MGNTFEVYSYKKIEDTQEYDYYLEYAGENMKEALSKLFELKQQGICYVKLEWRGCNE